ncbi:MAG: transcriptional repressor [Clostridiales bacterium]|nr:transcriptional repressor [Clostridiales bacterium]
MKNLKMDNIRDYLMTNDIKPSYQRIRIYEYLMNSYDHPRVDEIYKALIDEIPTLSKTTVYNTLNLFIEKGIIHMVTIEGTEVRYDVDISDHGHFKCDVCGKVYDFKADIVEIETNLGESFIINQKDLFFRGICPSCSVKN